MAQLVGARAYNSANISVANNTQQALTFDSERFDTDTIHSTSSNTGRLTATTAGIYVIVGHVIFAAHATGRRQISIRINGTTYIAGQRTNTDATDVSVLSITAIYQMAATDYAELMALQNSGGALNVTTSGNNSPEFAMHRVG